VIDRAPIYVRAGRGGSGVISFRREKFVPRGGPDGGDGGQGGSVILLADPSVSTLRDTRYRRRYLAPDGGNGAKAKMHGRSGKNLIIRVPVGTQVRRARAEMPESAPRTSAATDSTSEDRTRRAAPGTRHPARGTPHSEEGWELVADLDTPGATHIAAHGGMGGKGNARFTTSTNQAPRIAERGQRGQEARLLLDLKLISDVGIIGLPSVGKSTLIAAVSAARPKIAAYPFTTLEPVLGVVDVGYDSFVMADIPGLIEGAHAGVGLGHDFLRHVERTRLLVHLLDGAADDPLADMDTINRELALFSEDLARRPQIMAINKIDIPEARERLPELRQKLTERAITPLVLAAATGEGTDDLVRHVWSELTRLKLESPPQPVSAPETPVLRPEPRPRVTVERQDGVFLVHGRRVEAMAEMLDLSQDEPRGEFFHRLQRLGVAAAIRRAGARPGDRVRFGDVEVSWEE
jgi:GTP-binding protein